MADSGRARRFVVTQQAPGTLRIVQDVEIERLGPKDVTIISTGSIPRGEHMLLQILHEDGARSSLLVRAVEHRAVSIAGRVQQRVRLRVVKSVVDEAAS